jgi:hypothetical protein
VQGLGGLFFNKSTSQTSDHKEIRNMYSLYPVEMRMTRTMVKASCEIFTKESESERRE